MLTTTSLPSEWDLDRERARRYLSEYIRQAWNVIEPATDYMHNWHIDAISEFLQAVSEGQILRGVINLPPRVGKSIDVSIMWPTWTWVSKPWTRWLFTSYSGSLSTKHSVDRRFIIESEWYRRRWGDVFKLTDDQNQKTEFQNDKRGVMVAAGLGGTVTGKGADVVVVDDPHDALSAQSDLERQHDIDAFTLKFATRLDNKKTGAILIVAQRVHEKDLSQHCIDLGYETLVLPGMTERRTVITMPISGKDIIREPGDLLWEARLGLAELAVLKKELGSYGYSGQVQQEPAPSEGGRLKKHWWRFWQYEGQDLPDVIVRKGDGTMHSCPVVNLPESFDEQTQSWDMAFKGLKDSDYVVGQVWGKANVEAYLLDQVRKRMDIVETMAELESLSEKWPLTYGKLIEDKANGAAVMQMLRTKVGGLIAVEPEGGKESRVSAVLPFVEAGNCILPHPANAPWVDDFINECARFPRGANDDQVDTFTQVILRWQVSGVGVY